MEHQYHFSEKLKSAILVPLARTFLLLIIALFFIQYIPLTHTFPFIQNNIAIGVVVAYLALVLINFIISLCSYKYSAVILKLFFGVTYYKNGSRLDYTITKGYFMTLFWSAFVWALLFAVVISVVGVGSVTGMNFLNTFLPTLSIFTALTSLIIYYASLRNLFDSVSVFRFLLLCISILLMYKALTFTFQMYIFPTQGQHQATQIDFTPFFKVVGKVI